MLGGIKVGVIRALVGQVLKKTYNGTRPGRIKNTSGKIQLELKKCPVVSHQDLFNK